MKITKSNAIILIFTTIIGFIFVSSIGDENKGRTFTKLSAYDYKEAIEKRNILYKEIEQLEKENKKTQHIMNEYLEDDTDNTKVIETMKNQLKDYNMFLGTEEIKGPGVVLKINDGDIDASKDTNYEIWRKTFHDNDMAMVINEIRGAGAEAFSLNNKRIMPFSGVSCSWAFLGFEDDSLEYAPFYVFIIGNPDKLEASLMSEDSYVSKLKIRGLEVSITKEEEIVLKPSNQDVEAKFMEMLGNE